MFIKSGEGDAYFGAHFITYERNGLSVEDLVDIVRDSGKKVEYVDLDEDADVGMHTFGAKYSLNGFYELKKTAFVDLADCVTVRLSVGGRIVMYRDSDRIWFYGEDKASDLNELLSLK